jgi:glucan phosphoethanolaminetransferase (alkaline phosphatase superfamily)
MIEGVFLFFFTLWYVDRYYLPNFRIGFSLIILIIAIFSLLIIIWGVVADRHEARSLTDTHEKL